MRQTGGGRTGYHPFLLDICGVNCLAFLSCELGFRKCGEKLGTSEHTALFDSCDLRFCCLKSRSGRRHFDFSPHFRQLLPGGTNNGLQKAKIMNMCSRSRQKPSVYRTHPQRASSLRLNKYTSMELRKRGPFHELQDRLRCRRRRVGKLDCLSGCLLRL